MNTLAPPSLTSIRPGPRMITPPRISSSQAAVASGSGLRKWTWSQVTIGIVGLPWLFWRRPRRHFALNAVVGLMRSIDYGTRILAVAFGHGHPLDRGWRP